jgi:hypothetical protein
MPRGIAARPGATGNAPVRIGTMPEPAAVVAGGTEVLGDPVLALVVRLLGLLVALAMIVRNARRR